MKEYPEPNGRVWDVVEQVICWTIAAVLLFCVYMAWDFARWILTSNH